MSYGCGASDCKACYPFTYRCAACNTDFPEPVPNGASDPVCRNCGYDGVDPDTIDSQAKNTDGYCLSCGDPHEAVECPIYMNGVKA
jgi:hypothetical protein